MYFPDFYGIEIKCTTKTSKYPLYLFTVAFDGPTFPEINRIVEKYGYYDKQYTDKKVLYEKLYFNKKTIVNIKYKFKLEIDEQESKLYLCVYDLKNHLSERKSYVYLDTIYNHLMTKLKTIAIIYAYSITINNKKYFKYYDMNIYTIDGFDKFLELMKQDKLNISLISRISKSGDDSGRYRNKNLVFAINKQKVEYLFKKHSILDKCHLIN